VNNLLGNALKFSPSGSRVLVKLLHEGKKVMIQVIDSGPGISEELLPFVFEPFRQGTSRDRGVGLGLAIVDAVAQSHGGGIQVESGLNRGCCLTLSLPLIAPPSVAEA
jgi:signal transduction histidine kinase